MTTTTETKKILEMYEFYMRNMAENTRETYLRNVNQMFEFLNKEVVDITYFDLQGFIKRLVELGNTETSINLKISSINSFFRYCETAKILDKGFHLNTTKDKDKKKRDDATTRISSEMYDKILKENEKYYHEDRIRNNRTIEREIKELAILYLFMYGGLRKSEIINLKIKDVGKSVKNDVIRLKVDIVDSKRDKSRKIFLNEKTYIAMQNWLDLRSKKGYKSEYVFCTERDKKYSKKEHYTWDLVKKFVYRARLVDKNGCKIEDVTPHSFRHACGSRLAKKGIPAIEIAKFLGDTLEVVMKVYIHKDTSASYDTGDVL